MPPTMRSRSLLQDRRGSVGIIFAVSIMTLMLAIGTALNMAQMSSVRAALQRAVDNAALSGAAAYSANSSAFNTLAIAMATRVFCNGATTLPMQATVKAGTGQRSCSAGNGPTVNAVTDSYIGGQSGLTSGHCNASFLPPAPYVCGFIVTVSATVTFSAIFPAIFGNTLTISASAMAANPFIDFAKMFSMPNGVKANATYANSIWVYPLLLNSTNGAPDFTTNPGALPDPSACIGGTNSVAAAGGPDQVTCWPYVMIASGMYNDLTGKPRIVTINGVTTTYNNGIVVNPVTPVGITATTPLGIAFRSIGGGNYVQFPQHPGVYGYSVNRDYWGNITYVKARSGCIYSNHDLVYNTVGQTWYTTASPKNGEPGFTPNLAWSPLVTHWYYSSYLANNMPPSQTEITLQGMGSLSLPSVHSDVAQSDGNINGAPTYNASQYVPNTCPATTTQGFWPFTTTYSNDTSILMAYPANTNCSLYIVASSSTASVPPTSGSCWPPGNTPGQQYAAISCQSYGTGYYTFYWNDMGGAPNDDKDYDDGVIQLGCNGSGLHVTLLN